MEAEYQGMVAQATADADGNISTRFVPWQQAEALGEPGVREGPNANRIRKRKFRWNPREVFGDPEPIRKRTLEERRDDVLGSLVDYYKTFGVLPPSIMREIAGLYDISASDVSTEQLGQIAGHFLRMDERERSRQ